MAISGTTLVERLQKFSSSVISEADGVMVIHRHIASGVIAWAERLAAIEETIVASLNAGAPREQVFAANPRFDHIRHLNLELAPSWPIAH